METTMKKPSGYAQCQECGKPINVKNYLLECDHCLSKKKGD
ncbi:hypothetical protein ACFSMW_11165 [Virgibacillus halophilus]|uniref:YhfH-like protein n=1 Tax=Tigheibacillus halophilus TaxID=361280 RepID=A0ABU5C6I6_9BACI|nr:hypothetical protein [Virgibacillus halophilus]